MPALLYFVPGPPRPYSRSDLAARGLAHALESPSFDRRDCLAGPGGQAGVVVSAGLDGVAYQPSAQHWEPMAGTPLWVGWDTRGAPPSPDDLARATQLAGTPVCMADGNDWLCPIARAIVEEQNEPRWLCALPQRAALDACGQWQPGGAIARYAALWDTALAWWNARHGARAEGNTLRFDFPGLIDAAVACLAANYRLSRCEVSALGLLDDQVARRVLDVLVDWDVYTAILAKNLARPADSSGAGGPPDATPITAPR